MSALRMSLRVARVARVARVGVRFNSTAAPVDPKITAIVDQIAQLNLLETSSLVTELKSRLNIPDISFPAAGAAPAAAPAAAAEEAAPEVVEEKSIFNIKLESYDAKAKPKVIKEIKTLLGLSLVDAKKIVDAAPKMVKESVPKEDADKIKKVLEDLGAKITLE